MYTQTSLIQTPQVTDTPRPFLELKNGCGYRHGISTFNVNRSRVTDNFKFTDTLKPHCPDKRGPDKRGL